MGRGGIFAVCWLMFSVTQVFCIEGVKFTQVRV